MGFGVIDVVGQKLMAVSYGCIEPVGTLSPAQRLVSLHDQLAQIMREWHPDVVSVEELYFVKNVTTGLRVAEARGVTLMTAAQAQLEVFEYKPNAIKSAVTGYGKAEKVQVQKMVKMLLGLEAIPRPDDAADGLAAAICHAVLGRRLPVH